MLATENITTLCMSLSPQCYATHNDLRHRKTGPANPVSRLFASPGTVDLIGPVLLKFRLTIRADCIAWLPSSQLPISDSARAGTEPRFCWVWCFKLMMTPFTTLCFGGVFSFHFFLAGRAGGKTRFALFFLRKQGFNLSTRSMGTLVPGKTPGTTEPLTWPFSLRLIDSLISWQRK